MLRFPLHTDFRITSEFGARKDPFTGAWKGHNGIDLAVPSGTPIHAPAKGVVTSSFYNDIGGNQVIITHPGGIKTGYAHLSSKAAKGTRVKKNDIIGYSGSTGRSTGPHLHLTLKKNDKLLNPASHRWVKSKARNLTPGKKLKLFNPRPYYYLAGGLIVAGSIYYLLKD